MPSTGSARRSGETPPGPAVATIGMERAAAPATPSRARMDRRRARLTAGRPPTLIAGLAGGLDEDCRGHVGSAHAMRLASMLRPSVMLLLGHPPRSGDGTRTFGPPSAGLSRGGDCWPFLDQPTGSGMARGESRRPASHDAKARGRLTGDRISCEASGRRDHDGGARRLGRRRRSGERAAWSKAAPRPRQPDPPGQLATSWARARCRAGQGGIDGPSAPGAPREAWPSSRWRGYSRPGRGQRARRVAQLH